MIREHFEKLILQYKPKFIIMGQPLNLLVENQYHTLHSR